jgi:hypothetical protein
VHNIVAHIAQEVEHFLGKEEVTGSTPVMGSRKINITQTPRLINNFIM